MSNFIFRRDFIKHVAVSGASLALLNQVTAGSVLFGSETSVVAGENFKLVFDHRSGTFSLSRSNGTMLLQKGTCRVNTIADMPAAAPISYRYRVNAHRFSDKVGTGQRVEIFYHDSARVLDIETHIALYDNLEAVTIEIVCKNISKNACPVYSLEPVRAIEDKGGALFMPGVAKCLTNGALYYDAGMVHTFGTPFIKPEPYGETKGGKRINSSLSPQAETVQTWWNAGFFSGYDKEGLVTGYIENNLGLGQILISRTQPGQISFLAESVFSSGLLLEPGQSISSDRFIILIDRNPYAALETYAGIVGLTGKARTRSVINGWCNWFYTYEHITEDEIIRNAEFAAKHLKPYGMEYIQVDEGYQRWHGDWEGNDRFPHGMQWLSEKIRGYGLKAGIWVAPYVVSEPSALFQRNPEWLLKNMDGSLKRVGPWPDEDTDWARNENPRRFGLDITHPDAAAWLHDLFDTLANQWGFEMIKIDFVAWSLLSAHHYYDTSFTPAQAYRKGTEIMRDAIGEAHLLDCGPGSVSVGFIDSMRIELDQNYGYGGEAWKQYFLHSASSAPAAAKRYYFHKRTWVNDADHVCINMLQTSQAQAAASIIALSGGNMMSGDRLTELDAIKLDMLGKVFPAFGEAARPVDLFDTDLQTVFALSIKKPFGEWTVAGFFNADLTGNMERRYPLDRLWLEPGKTYLVYDFWKEIFVGEVSGEIRAVVPPGSVTLLALHEKSGNPQFISTSRHVMQGAVELEEVVWDAGTKVLSGISLGPRNSSHYVTVYLPDPNPWKQSGQGLFRDYGTYSLNMVDEHILRVWVHFKESEQVAWRVQVL